ncbi:MAG: hypothetical protein LBP59_10740 [Planctomycetaceae bacterium]|nr:hypothetical protein [Planctomycetaceae bacterium]
MFPRPTTVEERLTALDRRVRRLMDEMRLYDAEYEDYPDGTLPSCFN